MKGNKPTTVEEFRNTFSYEINFGLCVKTLIAINILRASLNLLYNENLFSNASFLTIVFKFGMGVLMSHVITETLFGFL